MREKTFFGKDQYGGYFHDLGRHPRKELLERLDRKHAEKIYVDDGVHVGYCIAGHWIVLYEVTPCEDYNFAVGEAFRKDRKETA